MRTVARLKQLGLRLIFAAPWTVAVVQVVWAAPQAAPAQPDRAAAYYLPFVVLAVLGSVGSTMAVMRARRRERDLRESAAALRESKRKYQVVADNTYDWEYWLDPAGRFLYNSPSCERITGFTPQEFEADPGLFRRLIHPADQPLFAGHWEPLDHVPAACELEFRIVRRDGEMRWLGHCCQPILDEKGNWLGQRGSNRDITSLRAAESHVRRLSQAVEQTPVSVMITDANGNIEYVNPKFVELTGYSLEEVRGRNPRLLKSGDTLPGEYTRLWAIISSGGVWTGEFHNKKKDGGSYWERATIGPMRDASGRITHYLAVKEDITAAKLSESERQRTTALLSVLLDNIHTAVMVVDDRRRILMTNRAFCEMFGGTASPDDFLDADCLEVAGRCQPLFLEPAKFLERLREVLRSRAPVLEEELLLADGRIIERDYVPMMVDRLYAGHLCMFRDVTERKRALQAIRERQAILQAVLDNAPIGIWMQNQAGRVMFINQAFCLSADISEERFLSVSHYSEVFDPASAEACMASDRAASAQNTPHVSHEHVLFADGQIHHLEVVKVRLNGPDGRQAGLVGLGMDVTERMRAEEQLRESESRYRSLIENLNAGVVVHRPDTTIELCNPAAATLLGLTMDQMAGKAAADPEWHFLRENGTPLPVEEYPVNRVLTTGVAISHQVYGIIGGAGQDPVWVLCNAHPVLDKAGACSQVIVSFTDITEHKLAEQRLLQAQKMESVGRLAGGVAHDFNNMLTVINGYSQLLLSGMEDSNPLRSSLEQINNAGERAAALTRQLLAFSRRQDLQPCVLHVNDLIRGMLPMLVRMVGEDVDVRVMLGDGDWRINADPHQIEQVVMNLVVNARDAMPRGGVLILETAAVEIGTSGRRHPPDTPAGRYILLIVSDNGVGMDEATRRHIFEPFFTLKETGKGTGLGLSMVQGIVAQSGGFIEVASKPGQGSTFRIYLPQVDASAALPGSAEPEMALAGTETVLLVEDQPEVLRFAAQALAVFGYRILTAGSPVEALAICQEPGQRIDLVLTDVVMPGLSGRELARQLESLRPEIKVLYMSGFTGDDIARHGVLAEGARFLPKPFTPGQLASKVRTVLDAPHR
ncbi:MAG: PAS domain S-box protein [Candidatus Solibacter usitatus]|nr:PAS domain S-box protein [Candidatus Solibacter usitatus]